MLRTWAIFGFATCSLLSGCRTGPPCPPVADWEALSRNPDEPKKAATLLTEACATDAPAPLAAWLADEAAGKHHLTIPPELGAAWKEVCPSVPAGDVGTSAGLGKVATACTLPTDFAGDDLVVSRGNPVLGLLVRQWLIGEGTEAKTADAIGRAVRGAPPYPSDAHLVLPEVPGEATGGVAHVVLAKDGVHAAGSLVAPRPTPDQPFALPLGASPNGWPVAAWKALDAGKPAVLAADATASAQDLVRLIASVAQPGASVRVLTRVADGVGGVELALPASGAPADGTAIHISTGGGQTVAGLLQAVSRLAAGHFPVTLNLDDSPCASAPDGMMCFPGGPTPVGAPDDATNPARMMQISTFYLDDAPVSSSAYDACVKADFCPKLPASERATGLTWEAANRFCTWSGKRLPTEWEWEKASSAFPELAEDAVWTRSWMESSAKACGRACEGPDPLGPCGGSEPCSSSSLRVRRGGPGVSPSTRSAASPGTRAGALRCALTGAEGQDPPPFFARGSTLTTPVLARPPAAQITKPWTDPGIPQAPTAAELQIVNGLAFDAIEDKPVCGEEKVKSWNFASGIGGRSDMDCRDPVSYVDTNEKRLTTFVPYILNTGGAYAGVGAAQNYDLIALAHSQWAFLFDYEPNVVRLHRVLKALILASDTPQAFLARFSPKSTNESMDLIKKTWPDDPEMATYQRFYLGYQARLATIYTRALEPRPDDTRFGWLSHPEQYTYIRTLYQQGRIVILPGDMLAEKSMREIGRAAKALNVPMRIFYTSNAPTSWGGGITTAWRANVGALPFDDDSLVLVTWNHGAFGQQDYWHYNVQRALMYQSRLQHPGYQFMWQLAWDRIPSGDPDLTLSGVAGG